MDKFYLWGQVWGQTLLCHLLPVHDLMCESPCQASIFLCVKWEFNPFFAGHLGELVFRYMVLPAPSWAQEGKEPSGAEGVPQGSRQGLDQQARLLVRSFLWCPKGVTSSVITFSALWCQKELGAGVGEEPETLGCSGPG